MQNNPLRLEMDKKRNESKNKLIIYEEQNEYKFAQINRINSCSGSELGLRINNKYFELENKYSTCVH